MEKITLRGYQQEAVEAICSSIPSKAGLIVSIPTGTGKSIVQAFIIKTLMEKGSVHNVLCLAHVKELLEQNESEMLSIWPQAPVGVYSAGLGRRELQDKITIAGVQSIYNKASELGKVDLVIVDEVHRFSDEAESMYMQLYTELKQQNPAMQLVGLTATPFRTKNGLLTESDIWQDIVYNADIKDMITQGFLCRVVTKANDDIQPDLVGIGTTAGDYIMTQAQQAMEAVHEMAMGEIVKLGADRKHWLLYGCTVEHCFKIANSLEHRGISSAVLSGDMSVGLRDYTIEAFKTGKIRALVNINILTTGFNFKPIDLIATLRPTKSAIIYVQSIGRGMRIAEDKQDCLFLDYAGWIDQFGPIDLVKVRKKKGLQVERGFKKCKQCNAVTYPNARVCPECGWEFPVEPRKIEHEKTASSRALFSDEQDPPRTIEIHEIEFNKHVKDGKPPSMCVVYRSRYYPIREWIAFESERAKWPVSKWWLGRGGARPVPSSTDEALARTGELSFPQEIVVRREGKWDRVVW